MKDYRFAKLVVFVNGLIPLALLCWDASRGRLGADPPAFVIQTTGMLALVFLMLSLAVTPLRRATGANWLGHLRKMLGLFAFFYATVHLLGYAWFDKGLDVAAITADTFTRRFIFVGMSAFVIMIPLALTSTSGMVKRLGGRRWRLLHRLAYVAGVLAVIHYWWFVKVDVSLPSTFAVVLAVLLGARLVFHLVDRAKRQRQTGAPSAA